MLFAKGPTDLKSGWGPLKTAFLQMSLHLVSTWGHGEWVSTGQMDQVVGVCVCVLVDGLDRRDGFLYMYTV